MAANRPPLRHAPGELREHEQPQHRRDYPPEAVEWLCYLRTAQSLGFTLAEIEAGMPVLSDPASSGMELRAALERKLADIDARIAGLVELRAALAHRLAEPLEACPLRSPATPAGNIFAEPV